MSEKQGIIKAVVVLVVICFVISGALAVVNSFTAPVSKANAEARETAARQELIPEAGDFEQVTEGLPENVLSAYVGKASDGSVAGYVITASGKGLKPVASVALYSTFLVVSVEVRRTQPVICITPTREFAGAEEKLP